jgi:hypothetical protein
MVLRTLTHAKTPKQDAHDMFWCVVMRGNTKGVTDVIEHDFFFVLAPT